jgi:hypothetical protein
MTDAQLDAAYEAAAVKGDMAAKIAAGQEIINRLTSVFGFLRATVSTSPRFPLYTNRTSLVEGDAARSSVAASTANVGKAIGGAVSGAGGVVGSTIFKATAPIMLIAAIGIVGLYVWKMPAHKQPWNKK